jgi:hypothetical protein
MLPQSRELGAMLYEAAATALGWRSAASEVRANSNGLILAKELGDDLAYQRLRAAAERENDPRVFGEQDEQFGWFFSNKEGFPRGQGSAMLMAAEIASAGDWTQAFQAPHMDKFTAPTVEGIDFPSLGVSQAWNDRAGGRLHVGTYAATPERRGAATSWRVTNLPRTTGLTIRLNGQPFTRFEAVGPTTIRIDTTIDAHQFEIVTGYRGDGSRAALEPPSPAAPVKPAAASASLLPSTDSSRAGCDTFVSGPGCPCCPSA